MFTDATTSMSSYLSGTDQDRLSRVVNAIDGPFEFYPTYVSVLDSVGHKCGPESKEMLCALKELDSDLESFYDAIDQTEHNAVVAFCGDHGMSPVVAYINIQEAIESLREKSLLRAGVRMFLDSTMARFWFDDEVTDDLNLVISEITARFGDLGFFVKREQYTEFGIPDMDMYGSLLWICNDGVVISPDYFNGRDKKVLGMHGYRPSGSQHYGCIIIAGNNVKNHTQKNPQPLKTVYAELKKYISTSSTSDVHVSFK